MNRSDSLPGCFAFILIAGSLLAIAHLCHGQARPSDAVVLARVSVHETGWEDTGDMEAIHAVILGVAERGGLTYRRAAWAYADGALDDEGEKAWASELTPACREPASWPPPPHAPWAAYRSRCLAVFARAAEVFAGERAHHCDRDPHDWGGVVDRPRARRLGLIRVECGFGDVDTVGDYYVRPSLVREGGER